MSGRPPVRAVGGRSILCGDVRRGPARLARQGGALPAYRCEALAPRNLLRSGIASGWAYRWRDRAAAQVNRLARDRRNNPTLNYSINDKPVQHRVPIERTPCTHGGSRSWFKSPNAGGGWRCSTCAPVALPAGVAIASCTPVKVKTSAAERGASRPMHVGERSLVFYRARMAASLSVSDHR